MLARARVVAVWAFVLAAACGDGGAKKAPIGGNRGDTDQDGGVDGNGPDITVESPSAAADPVEDAIVVGESVKVACRVTRKPGGAAVDAASVNAVIFAGTDTEPVVIEPAKSGGVDLYEATVPLAAVPGGPVRIGCVAADLDPVSINRTERTVATFFDAGPTITFTNLTDGTVVPAGEDNAVDVTVQFTVAPLLLAESDAASAIETVTFEIDGRAMEATLDEESNSYVFPIDFDTLFEGAPGSATEITVTATNKRAPEGATAKKALSLTIDGAGPVIEITDPKGQSPLIGQQQIVKLKITDAVSEIVVDAAHLYATIAYPGGNKVYEIKAPVGQANDTYEFTVHSLEFDSADITATIHAEDQAGNVSEATLAMRLDTVAPWVSMVPPNVRILAEQGEEYECSSPFDPLGDSSPVGGTLILGSPEDGQVIGGNQRFRALVWERTIQPSSATEVWYAGVDNEAVKLYIQGSGDPAILVDSDNDPENLCDSVGADARLFKDLLPVAAGGTALPGEHSSSSAEPSIGDLCVPSTGDVPDDKCENSGLSYVVKQTIPGYPTALYAVDPLASGPGCAGVTLSTQSTGGWLCIVAVAADKVGNLGFSTPLRVCQNPEDCDGVPFGEISSPPDSLTCTDGCKLPDSVTEIGMPTIFEQK